MCSLLSVFASICVHQDQILSHRWSLLRCLNGIHSSPESPLMASAFLTCHHLTLKMSHEQATGRRSRDCLPFALTFFRDSEWKKLIIRHLSLWMHLIGRTGSAPRYISSDLLRTAYDTSSWKLSTTAQTQPSRMEGLRRMQAMGHLLQIRCNKDKFHPA